MTREGISALAVAMSHATQPPGPGLRTGEFFLTRRIAPLTRRIPAGAVSAPIRERGR